MKKTVITRFAAIILAAFTLLITASFCTLSASAANVKTTKPAVTVAAANVSPVLLSSINIDMPTPDLSAGNPPANNGQSYNTGSGNNTADTAYTSVVSFFLTWIRRVGALVAIIGAVMFGLAIKNNDAEQKQQGILTMIAGFVVWAICLGASMFDLFT